VNYYAVLGVRQDATVAEIRAAYKAAALKFHPDKNKSPEATQWFQKLGSAFQYLSDPQNRSYYDRILSSPTRDSNAHDQLVVPGNDPMDVFEEFFGTRQANLASLHIGALVKTTGLQAQHLNNLVGTCMSWNSATGRWTVHLGSAGEKALQPKNLVLVDSPQHQEPSQQFPPPPVPHVQPRQQFPPPPVPHVQPRPQRQAASNTVPQNSNASPLEEFLRRAGCDQFATALVDEGIEDLETLGRLDDAALREKLADAGVPRALRATFLTEVETLKKVLFAPQPPPSEKVLFIKNQKNSLTAHQYPRLKTTNKPTGGRIFTFLVLGETGSGKTTLLDAFANCLSNQRFVNQWRWKLVDENHMQSKESGKSQTTDVTYYYVWDERDVQQKCHVRIIDTPGFGDTNGLEADEQIVKKFKELFERGEVEELDFILVVVKASEARWSNRQQYIHSQIEEVFGRDAKERFVLMCTFADGGEPQCLEVLKSHMTWQQHFKFNNSALYADPTRGDPTTKFFWDLGNDSVQRFLDFVATTSTTPMSLSLTRENLQTRSMMQARAEGAMQRIQKGIGQAEWLHAMIQEIKKNERDLNANKDFTFTKKVSVQKQVELLPDEPAFQCCTDCNQLCCQICRWAKGIPLSPCTYFHGDKGCPVCKGCPREKHTRQKYKEITVEENQTATLDGKKIAYEAAQAGLSNAEYAMRQKKAEVETLLQDILQDMTILKSCRTRLDEIALRKLNHSNVNLFSQMIEEEKKAQTPGFQARIAGLARAKERAEAIEKMVEARNPNDLFPQYQSELSRCMAGQKSNGKDMCAVM
jgi:GTP-binding protein EngB required for normal cell division